MVCQNCGKKEATTHIKRVVNGNETKLNLCADCAESMGYGDLFSGFGFNMSNIFSNFFYDIPLAVLPISKTVVCEKCKSTFDEIIKSGMMGCPECYDVFSDRLIPSIQRIHGKAVYAGKSAVSVNTDDSKTNIDKIESLKKELEDAVQEQNFERAATLRDEIKLLEGEAANL
ncbi:MAG: UvrB/UvrC motif-containing protein [Oscillospiraceae bacterium]|jgi:protein arginine kinase activator|nr:UvrB/UvrC motif-containing protein [Oscillospiraceae bacterium]